MTREKAALPATPPSRGHHHPSTRLWWPGYFFSGGASGRPLNVVDGSSPVLTGISAAARMPVLTHPAEGNPLLSAT
jgi:hypothetical protein